MKYFCFFLAAASCVFAKTPFDGRWDMTITAGATAYPSWMEVVDKDGRPQVRVQARTGAVRPFMDAPIEGSKMTLVVSPARGNSPEVIWELAASGDKLTGTQKAGSSESKVEGVRAPALKRLTPKNWSKPEPLFNGKDLTGWEPFPSAAPSGWTAKDGELVNETKGANLKTVRKFDDFKLHVEFFCPEGQNSGIYLRGRYEIQVGTEGGREPKREMGAIFGHYAQAKDLPLNLGTWQTYDITLVGRYVTVVRNGVTIHDNQEIPGPTGGALDSNESQPGPIYIQGDHSPGLRFRNITISVPKK